MNSPDPLTLPLKPQHRNVIFAMRLTPQEHEAIVALAQQINFPVTQMARHFVLQAVTYHAAKLAEKAGAENVKS